MYKYRWGLIFLSLLAITLWGCSTQKAMSPVAPDGDNIPSIEMDKNGHDIIASGTFEIDIDNMQVNDVTDRSGAFHYNITGFLSGRFHYYIQNWTPPIMTLRLEVENPTSFQVWDVRIIYTNLYGKSVNNPDGYTNYLDPPGGPEINPFHYFAKEYPNYAFPVGPGGIDSETLILNWPTGQPAFVTYVIECSLGGNAPEPYKIDTFQTSGNITPDGGAALVGVNVKDRQNDVSAVTILANDFYAADMPMFKKNAAGDWIGNLMNVVGVVPGPHQIWIKAESSNPGNIALWMPFTVTVPNVTDNAPIFDYLPFSERDPVSIGVPTSLNGSAHDPEMSSISYSWTQLVPSTPHGTFLGTLGSHAPNAEWSPPEVYTDTDYIFVISATENIGGKVSRAALKLTNEPALAPLITAGPSIEPVPLPEGDYGFFQVTAIDPNFDEQSIPFQYFWEQVSPISPVGTWAGTSNGQSRNPVWTAPGVNEDTVFQFKVTINKNWTNPDLITEDFVEFTVANTP